MTYTSDGTNFATPYTLGSAGSGPFNSFLGPALAVFNNEMVLGYIDQYTGYADFAASTDGRTFSGPATISSQTTASAPSLAVYNGVLYSAIQSTTNHQLVIDSSTNGQVFSNETSYPGITMGSAPAISGSNYGLVVAFMSNDSYHILFTTSGPSGSQLASPASEYSGIRMGSAPGLSTGFDASVLYLAFQSNDSYHWLFVTKTE
ncbi:MAG: hypothetical protein HIU93_09920 [Acidobacteria bacterium]|nr:hypothetical protein [Acidobacteriota bacterium]